VLTVISRYSGQVGSSPDHENAARPAVVAQATVAESRATFRRSKLSASTPPYRPNRIMGPSAKAATSDTAKVDWVRA